MSIEYLKTSSQCVISNNGLIGFNTKSVLTHWHGSDNLLNYENNITKYGESWPWANVDITYQFNSAGHRNIIDPANLTDYILVIGCSHTMGTGLPIDNVYWNQLNLKYPIYNLGISGSSNDLIATNLAAWLRAVKIKPKLIICQWTEENRFIYWKTTDRVGAWFTDPQIVKLFTSGVEVDYWKYVGIKFRELILDLINAYNIPLIEFGLDFDFRPINNDLYKIYRWAELDFARDIHGGPKSHAALASWIKQEFSTTLDKYCLYS